VPGAGKDFVEMFRVSERERGEIKERIALRCFGPIDHGGDLVTSDEDMVDLSRRG
jgi:hypothetical protein